MTTFATPDLEEFTFVEDDIPCDVRVYKKPCPNPAKWDLLVKCEECGEPKTRHCCNVDLNYWQNGEVTCQHHPGTVVHVLVTFPRSR